LKQKLYPHQMGNMARHQARIRCSTTMWHQKFKQLLRFYNELQNLLSLKNSHLVFLTLHHRHIICQSNLICKHGTGIRHWRASITAVMHLPSVHKKRTKPCQ